MVIEIDLQGCHEADEVIKKMAHVLKFPEYVDVNWDALLNAFTMALDLSETKLVFINYGSFKKDHPDTYNRLLGILDYTKKTYFGRNFDYEFQR